MKWKIPLTLADPPKGAILQFQNSTTNSSSSSASSIASSSINNNNHIAQLPQAQQQQQDLGNCPICNDKVKAKDEIYIKIQFALQVSGYHYGLLTCESCKASSFLFGLKNHHSTLFTL